MHPEIEFDAGQGEAINAAVRWYQGGGREPFLIYGPAGSGKSSIAARISELTAPGNTVFVAMTGKAAAVLRSKGCEARTLHSAIYSPKGDSPEIKNLRSIRQALLEEKMVDLDKVRQLTHQIKALSGGGRFVAKDRHKAFDGNRPGLVIVDEGSMVSDTAARDLAQYGVPTLVLGDPYQLPPVKATPGYRQRPNVQLTAIHRYGHVQGLLELATAARNRKFLPVYTSANLAGRFVGPYQVDWLARFDQVIVHRNTTRWNVIQRLRAAQDRPAGQPVTGDKIMVIRNDADLDVINGQQAIVVTAQLVDDADSWLMTVRLDDGEIRTWVVDARGFLGLEQQQVAKDDRNSEMVAATFAQAITCYAAQGSEWNSIAVIDESPSPEWMYTATTRAKTECIVLPPTNWMRG